MTETELKYPIGQIQYPEVYTNEINAANLNSIRMLPLELKDSLKNYTEKQAYLKYRKGSWSISQIVHHIFDSHLNAYCRSKFTLTETEPEIKPYDENAWADLIDAKNVNLTHSLMLIEHLHARWCACLENLTSPQLQRRYYHPAMKRFFRLEEMLHLYAWHGRHHIGQINAAFQRQITE